MKPGRWRALVMATLMGAGLLAALPLSAQQAGSGTAADAAAPPDERDVERLIATLEDPEARAALVNDLRTLLEAQDREAAEGESGAPAEDLVTTLVDMVEEAWRAIVDVDPRQLLTSIALSLLIVVATLALRWLALRLLRRVYGRLTEGGEEDLDDAPGSGASVGAAAGRAEAVPAGSGGGGDPSTAESSGASLPAAVVRLINLITGVLVVALVAESWGAGLRTLLQTDLGSRILQAGLAIGLILVFTLIAWHVAGVVVTRLLTLASGSSDAERTARRVDTLAPLMRSVLQGVVGVLAALLILSEIGIDIGPLLAGAGILGLAVGFGAQTLVKDLLTGVTILLEDGATLGDVVQVAGHTGVVEEMSIRTMRLRDLAGAVHLVPYSDVTSIVNFTQDYSYFLADIGVAYREDTDEVCAILVEVARELRDSEAFAGDITDDLEVLGVDKFADSAVLIRARLRTLPGKQWLVGREFNRRLKKAFDDAGVEIPFPHTTVYFGEPKQGLPPAARLAIASESD